MPTSNADQHVAGPTTELTTLDIAHGLPLGLDRSIVPLRPVKNPPSPVDALEDVLAEALARPPCLVSFSGGRDSSGLLALAARVSRSRGMDLPIPATLVFPGDAAAEEGEWQALVLGQLGLPDWVRIEVTGELDAVGPVATGVLRRHGLLWPFNTHFHVPIIKHAAGGSVVTGFGGDELGRASISARPERIVARQERSTPLDTMLSVGLAIAPVPVRSAVHWHRFDEDLPWLTRRARARIRWMAAEDDGAIPFGWDRKLRRWFWQSRYFRVCQAAFRALGDAEDVRVFHPFVTRPVLEALAARGGIVGFGSRAELVRTLFSEVLPHEAVTRTSKASFTTPLWTAVAVEFAQRWSGRGFDAELIDAERLRAHWLSDTRNLLSTTLLQAAWLHDERSPAS